MDHSPVRAFIVAGALWRLSRIADIPIPYSVPGIKSWRIEGHRMIRRTRAHPLSIIANDSARRLPSRDVLTVKSISRRLNLLHIFNSCNSSYHSSGVMLRAGNELIKF